MQVLGTHQATCRDCRRAGPVTLVVRDRGEIDEHELRARRLEVSAGRAPHPVMHQSVDPEVVIVEFEASGTVVATGAPYRMRYIAVITVRNNEIQRYRDYWSPLAAAEAMGGLQELLSGSGGGADE